MSSRSHHIGGRTLARCQALQLMFQAEACGRSVADVLAGEYAVDPGPLDEYGEFLARGADECRTDLDHVLSGATRNWSLSRMSATDRNLLRISLYEMLHNDEVPVSVSIDECVELAKDFGSSDESSRFVNAILGRIAAQLDEGVDVVAVARERAAKEASEAAERSAREAEERARQEAENAAYDDGYGYDDYGYENESAAEQGASAGSSSDDVPSWANEGE